MINQNFTNLAQATLDAGIGSGSSVVSLPTGYGALFPSVYPFPVKMEEFDTQNRVIKREIALCTNNVGDVLYITRAWDSCPAAYNSTTQTATAYSFAANVSVVSMIHPAKQLKEIIDEFNTKKSKGTVVTILATLGWYKIGTITCADSERFKIEMICGIGYGSYGGPNAGSSIEIIGAAAGGIYTLAGTWEEFGSSSGIVDIQFIEITNTTFDVYINITSGSNPYGSILIESSFSSTGSFVVAATLSTPTGGTSFLRIYGNSHLDFSSLSTQLGLVTKRIPVVYAEAASAAGKAFSIESQTFAYTPTSELAMGNAASNTKVAIPFYHSGNATTSLKTYLRKVGAPTDSVTFRIETDSSDAPSGTLVHANATYTVSNASLTASHAVITGTMTSWTATRGQKLWIVLSRPNAVDGANYYMLGTVSADPKIFMGYKLWNASVWGAKTAISIYTESSMIDPYVAVLSSTASGRTKVSGFADAVYSAGATGFLSFADVVLVPGTIKGNYYALSATSGDLSVAGSVVAIGYCSEDGRIIIMDDVMSIPGYFYQNFIGDNTAFSGQQVRAQFYCKTSGIVEGSGGVTMSFNAGGGSFSLGVLRAGAWTNIASGGKVFAGETVGFIVNGSGSGSSYVQFDWNIRFTPSF